MPFRSAWLVLAGGIALAALPSRAQLAPSSSEVPGSYDSEASAGCEPAGHAQKLVEPYLVSTTHGFWAVDETNEGISLVRAVSKSGSGDVVREGSAAIRWGAWTSSEETSCLCRPGEASDRTSPCTCTVTSETSAHTVSISEVDTEYPATSATRRVDGTLERLPGGRLALTVDGVRCVLKK